MRLVPPLALSLVFACMPGAQAARLELPLRIPFEPVRQALAARIAASSTKSGDLYREGRCRYLRLDSPKLDAPDGRLRLTGPGAAALGIELFGSCQNAVAWRGSMEFQLVPRIDAAGRLRLHIVDSKLTGAGGAASFVWDLTKRQVHPRIERFSYDLGASRTALLEVLRDAVPPAQTAAMEQVLRGLQVLEPRVEGAQIVVPVALDIPDAWLAAAPPATASAAPLTEDELAALEKALEPWDAFVVYSIRQLALDSDNSALRQRLFTLLLDSRYRLTAVLSGDAPADGDPLRTLFLDTWNELRAILADAERDGALNASLLRYAIFIDGGDALLALDQAAPGLGMRPSIDGLRSLARSLRPEAGGDPLAYGWEVDPELGQLFGVEQIPDAPLPGRSWLDFFVTRAYADASALPALDRWIPSQSQLPAYEARVARVLHAASADEAKRAQLSAPFDKVYADLVPTTALIESCWRQYAVRHGKVTYLRSPSGSIGIMQINQHVWRGFYNVERLRWNTAYNIRAGAQIVLRYLKDYAIPYAERTGKPDDAPRAMYAVYNAGPRAVGRFNKTPRHPREARVDDHLFALYQGIAGGGEADLASCAVRDAKTAAVSP